MMFSTHCCGRQPLRLNPGQVPAFTAEDIIAYLQGTPGCALGPTLSGEPPTVASLEFVGSKELGDRLNLDVGVPDDALVCYVRLRGPFHIIRLSRGDGRGPPTFETVEEIYDARTGQMLVAGAGSFKPIRDW